MVGTFGPESIEKMMPLVVNVLENLDSALADNQTHLTALMEVNEENQALSKQYQREKERRKEIEEVREEVFDCTLVLYVYVHCRFPLTLSPPSHCHHPHTVTTLTHMLTLT